MFCQNCGRHHPRNSLRCGGCRALRHGATPGLPEATAGGAWPATAPAVAQNWPVAADGTIQVPAGVVAPAWAIHPAPAPAAPAAPAPAAATPVPAGPTATATAPGASATAGPGGATVTVNPPATPTPAAPAQPMRWWVIGLIVLGVLAVLAFGVWAVNKMSSTQPATIAATAPAPTPTPVPTPPTPAPAPPFVYGGYPGGAPYARMRMRVYLPLGQGAPTVIQVPQPDGSVRVRVMVPDAAPAPPADGGPRHN